MIKANSSRKRVHPVFGLMLLAACLSATPSVAQLRTVSAPSILEATGLANMFLLVEGDDRMDALDIILPSDWSPVSAELLETDGTASDLTFLGVLGTTRYSLSADRPLHKGDRLTITLRSSESSGYQRIQIAPSVRIDGRLVAQNDHVWSADIETQTLSERRANRSARFIANEEQVAVLPLPSALVLDSNRPFLSTFWFRTTQRDEVILSTWTGVEGEPYAMEFMIDTSGHLTFFQGNGIRHVVMRSEHPIADGSWHFVSFENDANNQLMRLSLDGIPTDSLVADQAGQSIPVRAIRLGGRLPARTDALAYQPYSGDMDELRLIPELLTSSDLDDIRTHSVYDGDERSLVLHFDGDDPEVIQQTWKEVDSILSFRQGPGNLRVDPEDDGLRISFLNRDPDVLRFVISRSPNGVDYLEIAQVNPGNTLLDQALSFLDLDTPTGVVYYRVTPIYEDGIGMASPAIKAGVGMIEQPVSVRLLGNFPNPFNPTTTITYEVEEAQQVRISVWDLSGQMITSLVDGTLPQGRFDVQFDAGTLPSGTYFVRLESSAGIQTHQMILTK
ncbi:MAG: T9SS type A sorting domain-containing protein [Bacteroidetes bacterium]|nr:T9SS type A sorting domain-containing protein [Bacteroidota bacterium]